VWRLITKPLFPGYFFARFNAALSLNGMRHARGVLRVVGNSQFPVPLGADIISELQQRVEKDGFISLETKSVQPGDRVIIEEGPLTGWCGRVERESDDNKRVLILLEAVQQARLVIERRCLGFVAGH
jgi:transcriptional antiterminator RfaH